MSSAPVGGGFVSLWQWVGPVQCARATYKTYPKWNIEILIATLEMMVAYIIIYNENAALKPLVWGLLMLAPTIHGQAGRSASQEKCNASTYSYVQLPCTDGCSSSCRGQKMHACTSHMFSYRLDFLSSGHSFTAAHTLSTHSSIQTLAVSKSEWSLSSTILRLQWLRIQGKFAWNTFSCSVFDHKIFVTRKLLMVV